MPTEKRPEREFKYLKALRLDTYILSELLGPFIAGIIFFSFVLLMFQALRLADLFIVKGFAGLGMLKMIGLLVMTFMPMVTPVAFLIAILVGFGRLSADSELVAMKAHGVSVTRLTFPVVALASVVVAISLGLNLSWVPWSEREFKSTLIKVMNTKVVSTITEGTFNSGFFDLLIYADKVEKKTNRMSRVFIYDEREPKNALTYIAKEAEIIPIETSGELGNSIVMKLFNGSIHSINAQENTYQKIDFGTYQLFLRLEEANAVASVKPRMIAYNDLRRLIRESTDARHKIELETELWRRYGIALSPLIFVFLGIGFGTIRTRAVRAGAALVALTVILVYWSMQSGAMVLAQKGYLPPAIAMQLPNLLMLIAALRSFKTAMW